MRHRIRKDQASFLRVSDGYWPSCMAMVKPDVNPCFFKAPWRVLVEDVLFRPDNLLYHVILGFNGDLPHESIYIHAI